MYTLAVHAKGADAGAHTYLKYNLIVCLYFIRSV